MPARRAERGARREQEWVRRGRENKRAYAQNRARGRVGDWTNQMRFVISGAWSGYVLALWERASASLRRGSLCEKKKKKKKRQTTRKRVVDDRVGMGVGGRRGGRESEKR